MCFDDKNLYIGIKQNAKSNDFTITSLRRDFRAGGTDNISLLFDTFNDFRFCCASKVEKTKKEISVA